VKDVLGRQFVAEIGFCLGQADYGKPEGRVPPNLYTSTHFIDIIWKEQYLAGRADRGELQGPVYPGGNPPASPSKPYLSLETSHQRWTQTAKHTKGIYDKNHVRLMLTLTLTGIESATQNTMNYMKYYSNAVANSSYILYAERCHTRYQQVRLYRHSQWEAPNDCSIIVSPLREPIIDITVVNVDTSSLGSIFPRR
jgi:hypothetical protein